MKSLDGDGNAQKEERIACIDINCQKGMLSPLKYEPVIATIWALVLFITLFKTSPNLLSIAAETW